MDETSHPDVQVLTRSPGAAVAEAVAIFIVVQIVLGVLDGIAPGGFFDILQSLTWLAGAWRLVQIFSSKTTLTLSRDGVTYKDAYRTVSAPWSQVEGERLLRAPWIRLRLAGKTVILGHGWNFETSPWVRHVRWVGGPGQPSLSSSSAPPSLRGRQISMPHLPDIGGGRSRGTPGNEPIVTDPWRPFGPRRD